MISILWLYDRSAIRIRHSNPSLLFTSVLRSFPTVACMQCNISTMKFTLLSIDLSHRTNVSFCINAWLGGHFPVYVLRRLLEVELQLSTVTAKACSTAEACKSTNEPRRICETGRKESGRGGVGGRVGESEGDICRCTPDMEREKEGEKEEERVKE